MRRRRRPPPRRAAARRPGRAALPRSTAAARRSVRRQRTRLLLEGGGQQLGRMADVEARGAEVHRAAGVGRHDERIVRLSPARRMRCRTLRCADRGRELGLAAPSTRHRRRSRGRRRRSRARRYAGASTVRTAPCAFCTCRRWHGSCTTTVASGVAHGQRTVCEATHSEKSRTRGREGVRLGCAEQTAVVLHRRAASGAVDDDGRVAGHRRDHAPGEPAGVAARDRRGCAARRSSRRRVRAGRDARPVARITVSAARCTSRCHASITQPVKSVRVGMRGVGDQRCAQRSQRDLGSPNRRGTSRRRCAASRTQVSASSSQ